MKALMILLLSTVCLAVTSAQGIRQNSVITGLSLGSSVGGMSWSADIIKSSAEVMPLFGVDAAYGVSDHVKVHFAYNRAQRNSSTNNQLLFQWFEERSEHESIALGAMYYIGNSSSKLRPGLGASLNILNSDVELQNGLNDGKDVIRFSGWGGQAEGQILYFPRPFLSLGLKASWGLGTYQRSENFGFAYTEDISYQRGSAAILISYHFDGR